MESLQNNLLLSQPVVSLNQDSDIYEDSFNDIVLYKDQKAPNGMEGESRLTFYAINGTGFK